MKGNGAPIVASVVLVGACQIASPSGTLPTYDPGAFCSLAQQRPAMVHVDPGADPPTWMEGPRDGRRTNLEWPIGFSLRVTGDVAEVVDPDGIVVARDGTQLTEAGGGTSARGDDWFAVCIIGGRHYTTADP
jgi:hypothetical protein